jgi:hypothetical protein
VPEKPEGDKSKGEPKSRLQKIRREANNDSFTPDMPPLDLDSHLLSYFWEIGPTMGGEMGASPLTHGEIESWQRNVGIKLTAWECRTLKRLSIEYLNESGKATKRDCPPPWRPEGFTVNLVEVARSLEQQMERLMDL